MRRLARFAVGAVVGGGALVAYLAVVGVESVATRTAAVAPWALGVVAALVILEGLTDSVGMWASVKPLGDGLSPRQSVQFAIAGDFFDALSPAGPVSSEPIVARFVGVATGTTYSEALAVRSVAKYVKSGAQLVVSTALGLVVLRGDASPRVVVATLGVAVVGLLVAGAALVRWRTVVSRVLVVVLTPLLSRLSSLYRETAYDRSVVSAALDRFWTSVLRFRSEPRLLVWIAVAGVVEQLLVAAALWTALAGTGTPAVLLPIVAIVPLPQAASVVPVPASLGAYDVLLGGALVLATGAPLAAAAAALLLVRTASLSFALAIGGLAVALLRGWRP